MASADLSEELECSVCRTIYTDPVSLRCGHNFCRVCIDRVLDSQGKSGDYFCPQCRKRFRDRPGLHRNIALRNIAGRFLSTQPDQEEAGVHCTYCVDSPVPAVMSCLHCDASLCDKHLRVHSKAPEHVLCAPTTSPETRKCSVHKKILEYYCTEDASCVCVICTLTGEHRGHQVETLQEASEKKKKKLRNDLQTLVAETEEAEKRVQSLEEHRRKAQEKADGEAERVTALFRDFRRRLEELEKRVLSDIMRRVQCYDDVISQLEIKKEELSRKMRHIEKLCHMTDPLTVLQESDTGDLCDTEDRHDKQLHDGGDLDVAGISHTLHTGLADIMSGVTGGIYIYIQPADILLDVNTTVNLHISDDRKTASWALGENRPETPERFQRYNPVLSCQGYSSGRHYWEVDVGGSVWWRVGMCYPSIARRGEGQSISRRDGQSGIGWNNKSWCLWRGYNQYSVIYDSEEIQLPDGIPSDRVRIYLDYEAGQISFYALCDPIRHLHTFTATFTEPLHAALWERCVPVYCRYRFRDQPDHQTHGQTHGTHVFFRDVNVIFAGAISASELQESLLGPPVEIEVHDRDQKIQETASKPSLFGTEPEDEKLSNVGLVTAKRTVHNPITERNRPWDPYGVAKINLSELVFGATYLNICVPIQNCECPDPTGCQLDNKNGKILGVTGSVDGPQVSPLPVGHYLDAQSHLKVRIDLARPLSLEEESPDCPFGRMVFIFDYKNKKLFSHFITRIVEINAKALGLSSNLANIPFDNLSSMGLTDGQKNDSTLDVITGVHIMDRSLHLFILEGLKDKAMKDLWETISSRPEGERDKLEIFYNSDMAFHERLYKDLGVLLCHVHLYEPLASLVNQPLLYIRDMVPAPCFQALSRLDYMCSARKLRDVIQSDLLPSAEMIRLLSREFGIPFSFADLISDSGPSSSKKLLISVGEDNWYRKQLLRSSLDNYNEPYITQKWEMERQENKDHIKKNIEEVQQLSRQVRHPAVEYVEIVSVDGMNVHNYSSHTFNTTALAQRILRQKMAEEPSRRFTYSLDFLSAGVSPVDAEEERKKDLLRSREAWMTPNGFICPGFKSSVDCNRHPKRPDESRILELTKVWKENILHANTLQPTLCRDPWSWTKRHDDFNLYTKPPQRPPTAAPLCLADGFQEAESVSRSPATRETRMRFHRCLPQTELTSRGPQAGDQISKLRGLLKDKGGKLSLQRPGLTLKPIPALAVMPTSGEAASHAGFTPGHLSGHSLKWTENIIPRVDMEHGTFQRLRGKDFTSHSGNRSFIHKRKIEDLSTEEKICLTLMTSEEASDGDRGLHVTSEDWRNVLQLRCHDGFLLHIK